MESTLIIDKMVQVLVPRDAALLAQQLRLMIEGGIVHKWQSHRIEDFRQGALSLARD